MGLTTSFLTTVDSRNMNEHCQEWYNTISKDKVGELHFGMQDEECLNASKQNMCWAPCLILSIAWWVITSREILKNNWRMKGILDEPPCRASMKNSGNKRMIKRKRSWKHKVKPCDDLDGASWQDNADNLELRKRKDEASRTEKNDMMNNSGKKKLDHLDETRIRIILCVSFTNWWQATDLSYYLFSLKKDWREI